MVDNLKRGTDWIASKAEAAQRKFDKVDVRLAGAVAYGPGVEGSVSLLHGDVQAGFIPVGEGADVNISLQPRKGFEVKFLKKPADTPVQFSSGAQTEGGYILHGGAEVNVNPGGTVEVVPKVGVGVGEIVKYSPTINFIKIQPQPPPPEDRPKPEPKPDDNK